MRGRTFALSQKDLQRVSVICSCVNGDMACARAAELLSLSIRQVKRLKRRSRGQGEAALAHANRGRPSPRRLPTRVRLHPQPRGFEVQLERDIRPNHLAEPWLHRRDSGTQVHRNFIVDHMERKYGNRQDDSNFHAPSNRSTKSSLSITPLASPPLRSDSGAASRQSPHPDPTPPGSAAGVRRRTGGSRRAASSRHRAGGLRTNRAASICLSPRFFRIVSILNTSCALTMCSSGLGTPMSLNTLPLPVSYRFFGLISFPHTDVPLERRVMGHDNSTIVISLYRATIAPQVRVFSMKTQRIQGRGAV